MTPENSVPAKRRWGRSPALAVAIGILSAIAWLVFAEMVYSWAARDFGSRRRYYARGLEACRWELGLRAVAVQRFAQRTGHMPNSLSECEKDLIRLGDAYPNLRYLVGDSWNPDASPPAAWQDFLGLPIIYTRGQQPPEEFRFLSSEPFPLHMESYLKLHGGVPAASSEPFALSSLFMREVLPRLRRQENIQQISLFLIFAGLAIIIIGTVVLANRWRRFGSSAFGKVMLRISFFSVLCGLLFPSVTTCYRMASFNARSVSVEKRLRILDDAVKRGEISEEVAKTARSHIKKMFGYIEE